MEIRKIRILLIEDDAMDVACLRNSLEKSGGGRFELEVAESVAAALACLGRGQTDVVLTDLNLPDSTGLDTFHAIKAPAREVPVIVLSGMDDETHGGQRRPRRGGGLPGQGPADSAADFAGDHLRDGAQGGQKGHAHRRRRNTGAFLRIPFPASSRPRRKAAI